MDQKRVRSFYSGDICPTLDCGNLAESQTGFCTVCIPPPRKSFTVICIRFMLKQVLRLFGIKEQGDN